MFGNDPSGLGVPLYSTPSPMRSAMSFGPRAFGAPNPGLPAWGPAAAIRTPSGEIVVPAGTFRSGGTKMAYGAVEASPARVVYGLAGTAAFVALAYHGYKRNHNSIGWGIGWALLGGIIWPIGVGLALAQGFAKPAGK